MYIYTCMYVHVCGVYTCTCDCMIIVTKFSQTGITEVSGTLNVIIHVVEGMNAKNIASLTFAVQD